MDKYSLSWNEFTDSVSRNYRNVRNQEAFSDVTIVGNDQKPIFAHKLVLSGGSEYFENLLMLTKHSQMLVCLDGINSEELSNILDYIYFGEVHVFEDELQTFLQLAKRFKLHGLLKEDDVEQEASRKEMENEKGLVPVMEESSENPAIENDMFSMVKEETILPDHNFGNANEKTLVMDQMILASVDVKEVNKKLKELYTKDDIFPISFVKFVENKS